MILHEIYWTSLSERDWIDILRDVVQVDHAVCALPWSINDGQFYYRIPVLCTLPLLAEPSGPSDLFATYQYMEFKRVNIKDESCKKLRVWQRIS